ncbi:MAG: type III-B CRISPR module-associated protein Cmr3 [Zoogloeaceae bacterium]|jgi:CRISPR-associated protein Cmr3|nr:type III-B CRISPR module-associated protein Cmr3 [Zoogloeaceae bacterium]
MTTLFLEPLDVLFLRGNKLFGDPGSYGEALLPPWPSVAAGALRSRMLADAGIDLKAFAEGEISHPVLGTPKNPGSFTVTAFHLARRVEGNIEPLFVPPADLNLEAPKEKDAPPKQVRALNPHPAPQGILTSFSLPSLPILAQKNRGKPASGYWLTAAGWAHYLAGGVPDQKEHWVTSGKLWQSDERIGIGLNAATRSAKEGDLFSVQAVAFLRDVGFLAATEGDGGKAPQDGSLRLGGDGRATAVAVADATFPEANVVDIARARRCRLILSTPGIFEAGWLPTGAIQDDNSGNNGVAFNLHGVRARLTAAAVPRFATVSGWDLAKWQPKPAQRAAPTGSVYWLEDIEADEAALKRLIAEGLWETRDQNPARRVEGFNRCVVAAWNRQ